MAAHDGRRRFLEGLMMIAAGTAVATLLGGCADESEAAEEGSVGPEGATQPVSVRPGVHHFNVVPGRIPSVRTFDLPAVRTNEKVSTKAA
jgi:hypothetical protein